MEIGDKIRKARNFRGITQKELGLAIGFDEKSADVRIAQYETDKRKPKEDLIKKIAQVLDVNFRYLYDPPKINAEDVMFFLFDLDDRYGSSLYSVIDEKDPLYPKERNAISFDYNTMNDLLADWVELKKKLLSKDITMEEYKEWKYNWPDSTVNLKTDEVDMECKNED